MYGYIYKIIVNNRESSWNNHYYIGQKKAAAFVKDYWGSGTKLESYKKHYGIKGLERTVLAVAESKEELDRLEEYYIGSLWETDQLCMNLRPGGMTAGMHHTQEAKEKISATMKEKCKSPEVYQHLVDISRARGPLSEETKRKISEANKRAYMNKEVREKVSVANKGRNPLANLTEEQIRERYAKVRATRLARNYTSNPCVAGYHWYNNGVSSTLASHCPEGYVVGRLPFKRRKKN